MNFMSVKNNNNKFKFYLWIQRFGVFLVFLIILCGFLVLSSSWKVGRESFTKKRVTDVTDMSIIPKTIWTFWDEEDLPELVEKCINTWRKHNPGYTIVVLNPSNLARYCSKARNILGSKFADSPQRLSDMVRLCVLYEHGGLWADATMIMQKSLDFIFEEQENSRFEFYGYTIREGSSRFTQIESWFFGAVPESRFVGLWRDALMEMNEYESLEAYLESIVARGVRLEFISNPIYFLVYCAEQLVLQKLLPAGYESEHFFLSRSEEGPFQFVVDNGWQAGPSLEALCQDSKYRSQPMHKLMGGYSELIVKEPERFSCLDIAVF